MDTPHRLVTADYDWPIGRQLPLLWRGHVTTFNCATFALADLADLGAEDWIEPAGRSDTFYTVPAQIILDSYCELLAAYSAAKVDWSILQQDPNVTDGDIFCLTQKPEIGAGFVHMGKIRKRDGSNYLISKQGVGPIIETTLQHGSNDFEWDSIQIYRPSRK